MFKSILGCSCVIVEQIWRKTNRCGAVVDPDSGPDGKNGVGAAQVVGRLGVTVETGQCHPRSSEKVLCRQIFMSQFPSLNWSHWETVLT